MQIVIDVDKETYNEVIVYGIHNWYKLTKAIRNGTPKEKTGHWITTRTCMHDGEPYCDKCGANALNEKKTRFCPNCGCRMVESQESEG